MIRSTGFVAVLAALGTAASPVANREIEQLLESLKSSRCKFERNGTWYDPQKAAAHLGEKRDYLQKRDKIHSSEDFIRLAATESSLSGKPYHVACPDKPVVESKVWLQAELEKIRAKK